MENPTLSYRYLQTYVSSIYIFAFVVYRVYGPSYKTTSGELGKGMRFAVKLVSRTVDYGLGNVLPSSEEHNGPSTALSSSLGYGNNAPKNTESQNNGGSANGGGGGGGKSRLATEIAVLVAHDLEPDREPALWPAAKFHNRIFLMREVYQLWLESGRDVTAPPFATSVFASDAGDPFYDPPEDVLVSNCVFLSGLCSL